MTSFTIFSLDGDFNISVPVKPLPAARVIPAIAWSQAANGEWGGTDRGASEDYYEVDVEFFGTASDMEALAAFLQGYCRGVFKIASIAGQLFLPNVLQTGIIQCVIPVRDRVQQVFYSPTEDGVQELRATFRALAPTLVTSPAASLSGLVLQEQFEADKSTTVTSVFSYDQTVTVLDRMSDAGTFKATFSQEIASAIAILRYLMVTARAAAFAFPTLPGIQYPFGEAQGALPKSCKAKSFSVSRPDLTHWDFSLELVESFE